jgi:hypothetical protein
MKAAPIAALTVCAALLAGCAGSSSGVDWLLGRVPPSPPGPQSLSGILDLNSEPQGAQAAVSLGATCQTPCSLEVTAEAPFTVTFAHEGYDLGEDSAPGAGRVRPEILAEPGVRAARPGRVAQTRRAGEEEAAAETMNNARIGQTRSG